MAELQLSGDGPRHCDPQASQQLLVGAQVGVELIHWGISPGAQVAVRV